MASALSSRLLRALPVIGISLLLFVSLWFMGSATHNHERFESLYLWILLANLIVLGLLALLIAVNLVETVARARRHEPGSRLTLRLVLLFVILSVAPVSIVYHFSIGFLHRGVDSWFDVRVEGALEDALELSRNALDIRVRQLLADSATMAGTVGDVADSVAAFSVNDLLADSDAAEITLFGANNRIIATGSAETDAMVPRIPSEEINMRLAQGRSWHGIEPGRETGLDIRIVTPIPATPTRPEARALQAIYPIPSHLVRLADNVQDAFSEYKEFAYLREPLKQSFIITLSLVLMLTVFTAIWAAFRASQRLMTPIRDLAEGTRAVAEGRYHTRLPEGGPDDLGYLLRSFNEMTAALAAARDEADSSRRLAESRRAFVEAVLQHLSSGVVTVDFEGRLRAANATAATILEIEPQTLMGEMIADADHKSLGDLYREIAPFLEREEQEWQTEVAVFGTTGRKVLIVRGARLADDSGLPGGYVLVIDDITALIQAQRDAAWGEVARRLAHEIKNPLTPIQLSAERLAHKLGAQLDPDGAKLLDRATQTIIQQVEAMKSMVNAFSEYARPPVVRLERLDLNQLVRDVVELYRSDPRHREIALDLDDQLPPIEADSGRLRQLLHNLIKNAIEATEESTGGRIEIRTVVRERGQLEGAGGIDLIICDNGTGIDPAIVDRIFEPYVTNRPKGTGLGLAVVRKIVEEHGGSIRVEGRTAGGSCFTIYLPARVERREA